LARVLCITANQTLSLHLPRRINSPFFAKLARARWEMLLKSETMPREAKTKKDDATGKGNHGGVTKHTHGGLEGKMMKRIEEKP
jgi:hypothetical protein